MFNTCAPERLLLVTCWHVCCKMQCIQTCRKNETTVALQDSILTKVVGTLAGSRKEGAVDMCCKAFKADRCQK